MVLDLHRAPWSAGQQSTSLVWGDWLCMCWCLITLGLMESLAPAVTSYMQNIQIVGEENLKISESVTTGTLQCESHHEI